MELKANKRLKLPAGNQGKVTRAGETLTPPNYLQNDFQGRVNSIATKINSNRGKS